MTTAVPTTVSDFYCHQALSGLVDLDVVEETANTIAFHHTRPAYPVHIVVIPKEHTPSLTDLGTGGPELLSDVVETVRKVARKVEEEHGACSITTNLGLYQESKHLHWHVIYRGESEEEIFGRYGRHDG